MPTDCSRSAVFARTLRGRWTLSHHLERVRYGWLLEEWDPHLSSFMKRFLRRSSSADVTSCVESFEGRQDTDNRRTVGPLLHVLHELGRCSCCVSLALVVS